MKLITVKVVYDENGLTANWHFTSTLLSRWNKPSIEKLKEIAELLLDLYGYTAMTLTTNDILFDTPEKYITHLNNVVKKKRH